MKIIRKSNVQPVAGESPPMRDHTSWTILVVDDDPDVLAITRISLKDFRFSGRGARLLFAQSAKEALEIYRNEPGIALALIDVVMETDDAGLKLVQTIREEFQDHTIRLIIRTGQPGHAPERYVIDNYDIDDYKEKTELTSIKLYTTVRSALKSYRDLQLIETSRKGLEMVLNAAPGMYLHPLGETSNFFREALSQVVRLCEVTCHHENPLSPISGFIATHDHCVLTLQCRHGQVSMDDLAVKSLGERLGNRVAGEGMMLDVAGQIILPLMIQHKIIGVIYLEHVGTLSENERSLLEVFSIQCANALENMRLYDALEGANRNAMRMLAVAAEFKDSETGDHVKRLARQTVETALELGCSNEDAMEMGQASMMHDIGKIGIPDAILLKPGRLTDDEFEVIKSHPGIGAAILAEDERFKVALQVALSHHERWDGTGYPMGLKGEEIPLSARIVAVVDVFDALVSVRPYKKAWSVAQALEEIQRGSGSHFDPTVVEAFLKTHHNRGEKKSGNPFNEMWSRRAMDRKK
ncbi:MAG: DUF3369 domain-containing protein [Magnetococcales bacterium]|nr:DUF3369 domain-containing protein [Magnetococcales bacterium]MBF0149075.1 DUF3369 domain-containing protein [Magnetococcales bacterium]MBF0172566.1 DUF3369 domain-containing protein [Magnetococcales bacterium]MBF0347135.1 DUF3369 domain-containing protein [Magnetococcales bacterium]